MLIASCMSAAEMRGEEAGAPPPAEGPKSDQATRQRTAPVSETKPEAEQTLRTETPLVQTLPGEPPAEFRGPDVTIIAGEERMVYEYRQNGQLRMIKVVPSVGRPYYLVPRDPTQGFGDLEQARTLVPEWVIWEF